LAKKGLAKHENTPKKNSSTEADLHEAKDVWHERIAGINWIREVA
jgi:hypothetical protein